MVNKEGFPLGFFVTSRPEHHLKNVWDTEDIAQAAQFISLSNIRNPSKDIQTVLESGFSRILNDRGFKQALVSVPRPWPSRYLMETLVERCSGQFIYAATVLKFVSNRNRNPDAQLKIVLAFPASGSDTSPFADLDSLYHGILSRADDPERTMEVLSFLLVIAIDVNLFYCSDLSLRLIRAINEDLNRQLLVVEQLLTLPPGEAFLALNDLHSLINLGTDTSNGCRPISFYHKSFRDFLLTASRSKEFYVDIKSTHAKIIQTCIKYLYLPQYNTAEQHVGWLYSFFTWPGHIDASGRTGEIHNFEHPVQRFIGNQLLSHIHLKKAFRILGLEEELTEVAEVLTGFRRLSASTFYDIVDWDNSWTLRHELDDILQKKLSNFKECIICSPILVAHLKSYKMHCFTAKRALAIHAIVPFDTLYKSGMYSMGIIHQLASLPEIQKDMIDSNLFTLNRRRFVTGDTRIQHDIREFLSSPRSSGIFYCAPEDFADAYIDIINIATSLSSERQTDRYSDLLRYWAHSLHSIKPAATPPFLAALKSTACEAYDKPGLIGSPTREGEVSLLKWLEHLPNPPRDVIDAWRKAFDKARRAYNERTFE